MWTGEGRLRPTYTGFSIISGLVVVIQEHRHLKKSAASETTPSTVMGAISHESRTDSITFVVGAFTLGPNGWDCLLMSIDVVVV